jgi:glycosyltransferase involved in cell wall biosynthesis
MAPRLRLTVFGHNDWWVWTRQGFATRNAALVRELGGRHEVESIAVVDSPRFFRKTHRPSERSGEQVSHVAPRIGAVSFAYPLPLPGGWGPGRRLNECLAAPALLRRLRAATGGRGLRVLWVADPRLVRLAVSLPRDLLVFDAIDDWREHAWAGPEVVREGYRLAAAHADVVFAVNPSLLEWLEPRGHAEVLFNAVHPARWAAAASSRDDESGEGPVVGYAGMIQNRLDTGLLGAVARQLPDVTFILAGPVRSGERQRLGALPGNVRCIGSVPHDALPSLVAGWSAAMVPHRRDALTASMDPLKLYEYLAAGTPVVSSVASPNPALRDAVRVVDGPDAFAAALREEMAADSPGAREERRRAVAGETWSARADRVLEVLRQHAAGG